MGSAPSVNTFDGVLPDSTPTTHNSLRNNCSNNSLPTPVISLIESSVKTALRTAVLSFEEKKISKPQTSFEDSSLVNGFMGNEQADELFLTLLSIDEKHRAQNVRRVIVVSGAPKYPSWTKHYGCARKRDGAMALNPGDRNQLQTWGCDYEGWTRLEEPPMVLKACCTKLKEYFGLEEQAVNSIEVHFSYNANASEAVAVAQCENTDCLQSGSTSYHLTLGAPTKIMISGKEDVGKRIKSEQVPTKQLFPMKQGDLFALGPITNSQYCHAAVPTLQQQNTEDSSSLRISVIFRSVDKFFIDQRAQVVQATYFGGKIRHFTSECITTKSYDDIGTREHVAYLINHREVMCSLGLEALGVCNNSNDTESNYEDSGYGSGGGGGGRIISPSSNRYTVLQSNINPANSNASGDDGGAVVDGSGKAVIKSDSTDTLCCGVDTSNAIPLETDLQDSTELRRSRSSEDSVVGNAGNNFFFSTYYLEGNGSSGNGSSNGSVVL